MLKVPFLDLRLEYEQIGKEIDDAIKRVNNSCAFAGGPFVEEFEGRFASFCETRYAVGVGSGTEALWFVLLALGVGPGDEVITVPNTFIATAEAISFCGARPVFVDVDEKTYNMNPDLLRAAITSRTKAVIPVHLFGQMADMDPIVAICNDHGVPVVEDACQAHGARYRGRRAGSIGIAGCFSFYPGKNLGAYGEAGAVVTNDSDLARKVCLLRDHGMTRKYEHCLIGWNGRMDGMQAAVLGVKLKYLDSWNEARRRHAVRYQQLLSKLEGLILPEVHEACEAVYHIYAVRLANRDQVIKSLENRNVACGIHYPTPIHLQQAYKFLGYQQGSFPVAEKCAAELLSLPMYPLLSEEQVSYVVEQIKEVIWESTRKS